MSLDNGTNAIEQHHTAVQVQRFSVIETKAQHVEADVLLTQHVSLLSLVVCPCSPNMYDSICQVCCCHGSRHCQQLCQTEGSIEDRNNIEGNIEEASNKHRRNIEQAQ